MNGLKISAAIFLLMISGYFISKPLLTEPENELKEGITTFEQHNIIIEESESTFVKKATELKNKLLPKSEPETPRLYWKTKYEYDYETGKGPKELMDLDGKVVKIPGFIVPLTDTYIELDEFLIVPDGQACIHVPPPPPNLIVASKLREPIPFGEVYNPSWITGIFKIEKSESVHGGSAFKMDVIKMERFDYEDYGY